MRVIRSWPSAFAVCTAGRAILAIQPVSASVWELREDSVVPLIATSCTAGHACPSGNATVEVAAREDSGADVGTCTVEVNGALEVEGAVVLVCAAAVPAIVTVRTVLVAHATAVRAHTRTLTCSP
ncbi:MAG: hypothetical protein V7706_17870 [Dietzia psychralcaliphila]